MRGDDCQGLWTEGAGLKDIALRERYFANTKGNQGDLLTTLLACAGVPNDRPVGIATKQIEELKAQA